MSERKLLVVGSSGIHTFNTIDLIKDYFSDVFLINDKEYDDFKKIEHRIFDFSFSNPLTSS